jgi:hypothetical protein
MGKIMEVFSPPAMVASATRRDKPASTPDKTPSAEPMAGMSGAERNRYVARRMAGNKRQRTANTVLSGASALGEQSNTGEGLL